MSRKLHVQYETLLTIVIGPEALKRRHICLYKNFKLSMIKDTINKINGQNQ